MPERIGNPVKIGSEPITVNPASKKRTFSPFMVTVPFGMGRPRKRGQPEDLPERVGLFLLGTKGNRQSQLPVSDTSHKWDAWIA
jgi:hypothetical protein